LILLFLCPRERTENRILFSFIVMKIVRAPEQDVKGLLKKVISLGHCFSWKGWDERSSGL
jgi:hypothetical protein